MLDLDFYQDSFAYDSWATLAWLKQVGDDSESLQIIAHILAAQKNWLTRCQGQPVLAMPVVEPTEENVHQLREEWLDLLAANKHDPVISFRMISGVESSAPISIIVRQVLNHGTYHRGELRGLCRAKGSEDFPETDYFRFYKSRQ